MNRTRPFVPRYLAVLAALIGGVLFSWGPAWGAGSGFSKVQIEKAYGKLPLHFIHNQGQMDERVKYYTQGSGPSLFFTSEGIYFTLPPEKPAASGSDPIRKMLHLQPLEMRPGVEILGLEAQDGKVNYFIGNEPQKWRPNIPTFKAILYREAYPGIDLKFYGSGQQLEYDLIVKPGADPTRVKLRYAGSKNLRVNSEGDLMIELPGGGALIQKQPVIYQELAGRRVPREGKFRLDPESPGLIRLALADYDRRYPLVIDPVLSFSTFLGGGANDYGWGIAVDGEGNIYITGETFSTDFPKAAPYDGTLGGTADAFVTKINAGGTAVVYSTYLGGGGGDGGMGIAVDQAGNAYVIGNTKGSFPLKDPIQDTYSANGDVFVTKLNASGSALIYSTYLGGSLPDYGRGIAVDASGNAYITGETASDSFPTTDNAYDKTLAGTTDAFVARIGMKNDPQVGHEVPYLVYSTFLGGNDVDSGSGIAVDGQGNAYVTGWTNSFEFPNNRPSIPFLGGNDVFVTKFGPTGALVYSLRLGGSQSDYGRSIAVDTGGCAYVTGETDSGDFPKKNYVGNRGGTKDAFVARFNNDGSVLVYSRYLGGTDMDWGRAIAVDGASNAYVTGWTRSSDFPTPGAFQTQFKGQLDAFVTKVNPDGTLAYSSYLGGSNFDYGTGIAVGPRGNVFITGHTSSATDFPTKKSLYPYNSGYDVFVVKLSESVHVPLDLLLLE
jgi:hypothetical protein